MKLGITATREQLSFEQHSRLAEWIRLPHVTEVHHGDCLGGDKLAHEIALKAGKRIIIHPPVNPKFRAWCTGPHGQVLMLPELPYHFRNRSIVDSVDVLLGLPSGPEWKLRRSGTWSTIRYARRKLHSNQIVVIDPGEDEDDG